MKKGFTLLETVLALSIVTGVLIYVVSTLTLVSYNANNIDKQKQIMEMEEKLWEEFYPVEDLKGAIQRVLY